MNKSFHLYLDNDSADILHSYAKTKKAIDRELSNNNDNSNIIM